MELALSWEMLLLLLAAASLAGFIDAIAGGGGLLTVPALLAAGLPPAMALGTNKLQGTAGSFSATWYFVRRGAVNLSDITFMIICTFIGSVVGTILVQMIDASILRQVLPFLILAVGGYFLFSPRVGETDRHSRISARLFALTAGAGIGFYDGFFGPGTGSFFAIAFVTLLGFNLAKATAHTKVLNFTSNVASLLFFALGGKVVWSVGLLMMVGQFIGARLGARMVLTKGQSFIRPMIVTVSLLMTCKMVYDSHGTEIYLWLSALVA
ncbi:TSUP family transporter [Plesiomonas shigelloides]|uniref:TSUP family transporter n=1 Tax=Plesiomonas shigelloides TaxID=703 RepID=UPI002246BB34|nr:TSUP family transporter [Plesiomonas shigelloides]MCX2497389.1 TSUP family transporter [Plesiomonas shigelloides]